MTQLLNIKARLSISEAWFKSKLLMTAKADAWDSTWSRRLSPPPPPTTPVATLQNRWEEGAPRMAGHGWREGSGAGPIIPGHMERGRGCESHHIPPSNLAS